MAVQVEIIFRSGAGTGKQPGTKNTMNTMTTTATIDMDQQQQWADDWQADICAQVHDLITEIDREFTRREDDLQTCDASIVVRDLHRYFPALIASWDDRAKALCIDWRTELIAHRLHQIEQAAIFLDEGFPF